MNKIRITNSAGFVSSVETDLDFIEINGIRLNISSTRVKVCFFKPEQVAWIPFLKALRTATGCNLAEAKSNLENLRGLSLELTGIPTELPVTPSIEFLCRDFSAAAEFIVFLTLHGIKAHLV